MAFKKRNKLASGGKRKGAGRAPDWFRQKCESIISRNKLVEFMADVANGEKVDRYVTEFGHVVDVPASVKDRMRAVEFLSDRAFGKATEHHELSGSLTLESIVGGANT